jgi:hypothetical protein
MAKKAFVYDGTQWVDIAQSTTDLSAYQTVDRTGLNVVVPTGATNGTVSANGAVTIGSAVSSVTVSGAFSATYDNYLIILSGGVGSTATGINLTLGATATGYYRGGNYTSYGSTTVTGVAGNNVTNWQSIGVASTTSLDARVELYDPFLEKNTKMRGSYASALTTGESLVQQGFLNNTTSYTDFTFTKASGTLTGGTIRIYGYNNGA